MTDKIAAFVPTSGIQFSESPWDALKSGNLKVNLMAHHSNQDGVFPINQYDVRSYVTNIALKTGCTNYSTMANYKSREGDYKGMKQRWVNRATGNVVQLFMYDGGGHWPSYYNRKEIWAFCKQFSLPTAREKYEKMYTYGKEILDMYTNDPGINTKTAFTGLRSTLNNYAPEKMTEATNTKLNTAYSSINTKLNDLETYVTTNSQKVTISEFDPNLHIYLCFGQSNSEGNATPELIDYALQDKRFLTMSAVSMTNHKRTKNNWYMARPPLCRDNTGLTPGDYFGRKMAKGTPDSVRIGVINVSLGGCAIEMFNEDGIANYIKQQADWLQSYARSYNNNPFRYLVDAAKEAQKVGVIKGILLHQGCSNNTQPDWPDKVKVIYERLLKELDLSQDDVPLLVGELLAQNQGGVCFGHNAIIAKVPSVIKNAHVVSSKDCNGAYDGLHFTAEGYRKLGENYAKVMLRLEERYSKYNAFSIKKLVASKKQINMALNSKTAMYMFLTDLENEEHDVTTACEYTSSNPDVISFDGVYVCSGSKEGTATVTATFTNNEGETISTEFEVSSSYFPLASGAFNPSILKSGSITYPDGASAEFKSAKNGMGGWIYENGIDLTDYNYLTITVPSTSLAKPTLRIYDVNDPASDSYAEVSVVKGEGEVNVKNTVDLKNMTSASGKKIDPSHICIVGVTANGTSTIKISSVKLSVNNPTDETGISTVMGNDKSNDSWFDLSGRRATALKKGIYVKNGKKIIVK